MKTRHIALLLAMAGVAVGLGYFAHLRNGTAVPETTPLALPETLSAAVPETVAGWVKYAGNPLIGGKYGTCFDISVLKAADTYRMWLSWRPKRDIALTESADGINWSKPTVVLRHDSKLMNDLGLKRASGWEGNLNRPVVVRREDGYHMWYSGFNLTSSAIGYATSPDGVTWKRMSNKPVLWPEKAWEKQHVMCPHVIWDKQAKLFKMWYSGGERVEPDAIGYATSPDGLTWTKCEANPIFIPSPNLDWEKLRVTACQVEKRNGWYLMFYIGFNDSAQIGIARSKDGITHWERHPQNPIIRTCPGKWDQDGCYKPFALFDGQQWRLWYNGRRGALEQIGLVTHQGEDLGFDEKASNTVTKEQHP